MNNYFEEDNLDLDCYTSADGDKVAVWLFTDYILPKSVLNKIKEVQPIQNVEFDKKTDELSFELPINPQSTEEEIGNALSALNQVHDILQDFEDNGDGYEGAVENILDNLDFKVTGKEIDDDETTGALRLHDNGSGLDFWVNYEIREDGDYSIDWNQDIFSKSDDEDMIRERVQNSDVAYQLADEVASSYLYDKGIIKESFEKHSRRKK